jgi:DNA polymerase III subunit gamma/tau
MQSLAVKYRPKEFSEVAGQTVITKILNKAIEEEAFSNTILFAGPSGTGKTTLARIFANKINKGLGKPIEIDAASNNGVDQVRSIIDDMSSRALVGEYKTFVIDECHMISKEGWNAFLKGIEECPKFTVLIFCTTEPNKIPATILNRVQRYNLSKIPTVDIKARLEYISAKEGFSNYEDACDIIAKTCQGGMRDAIATLEQCASFSMDLSAANVRQVLGESNFEIMFKLTWAIQQKKDDQIISILDSLYDNGSDLKQFMSVYLDFVLDLEKYILSKDISMTSIPEYLASDKNPVVQFTVKEDHSLAYFISLSEAILDIKQKIKYDNNYKSTIEILLLRFSREAR